MDSSLTAPPTISPAIALGVTASLAGRRWVWRPVDERAAERIAQLNDLPDVLGRLLAARHVSAEAARGFLDPTLREYLPDPSILIDMDRAASRLADAAQNHETIGIFGDYDVDGACSGALMALSMSALGAQPINYVPDRLAEGYGPNAPALRALADRGASLIICVDCGATAHEPLASLQGRTDAIVLDHHTLDGPPPAILATVNPNRLDDRSGLGTICAASVVFLTLVATQRELRKRGAFAHAPEPDLRSLLDLVALATVCDVMPLTGLNRALVTQGLKIMARRARPGIAALLDVAGVNDAPTAANCGFALGPRINAAGRIAQADLGLCTLLADHPDQALRLARELDQINQQRQAVEAGVLEAAMAEAQTQFAAGAAAALVVGEGWHPGIVGIIAGRIKEKFNRPALVAGISDDQATGSGRSITGIDLGSAIIRARQNGLLRRGGGHAMAAGFALDIAKLDEFRAFLAAALADAAAYPRAADLVLDGTLAPTSATIELAATIARLGPFGAGNPEPIFVFPRLRVSKADCIGRDGNTIRAFLQSESGASLKAMLFRAADTPLGQTLLNRSATPLHIAGQLRIDRWNGATTLSVTIQDATPA